MISETELFEVEKTRGYGNVYVQGKGWLEKHEESRSQSQEWPDEIDPSCCDFFKSENQPKWEYFIDY